MRLLAFAFTIVFVWTLPYFNALFVFVFKQKNQGVRWEEQTMCSRKLMLLIIVILVVITVLW